MTTQSNSPQTYTAGEALTEWLRVKAHGRTVYLADAVDYGIGVVQETVAITKSAPIRLDLHGGTSKMTASGVITAGQRVYAAANGKIAATGSKLVGTALDTASGNGSVIEVLPHPGYQQSSSSSSSSSS